AHAEEDKRKRELIDERNKADQIVWQMEKLLKDNADKVSEADKAPIQAAIEKVKQAASREDVAAIRQAIGELEQASHAMAQHLYSKGQQGGPSPSGAQPTGDGQGKAKGSEDVVDAEYEVKK